MRLSVIIGLIIIIAFTYKTFDALKVDSVSSDTAIPTNQFSAARAMAHVENLSVRERYVGSQGHKEAKAYLMSEQLTKMGLEPTIQSGFSVGSERELCEVHNILARIKGSGNNKAVMVMSHYDSDPHSSYGASDAASGIATILEGIRAFFSKRTKVTE